MRADSDWIFGLNYVGSWLLFLAVWTSLVMAALVVFTTACVGSGHYISIVLGVLEPATTIDHWTTIFQDFLIGVLFMVQCFLLALVFSFTYYSWIGRFSNQYRDWIRSENRPGQAFEQRIMFEELAEQDVVFPRDGPGISEISFNFLGLRRLIARIIPRGSLTKYLSLLLWRMIYRTTVVSLGFLLSWTLGYLLIPAAIEQNIMSLDRIGTGQFKTLIFDLIRCALGLVIFLAVGLFGLVCYSIESACQRDWSIHQMRKGKRKN